MWSIIHNKLIQVILFIVPTFHINLLTPLRTLEAHFLSSNMFYNLKTPVFTLTNEVIGLVIFNFHTTCQSPHSFLLIPMASLLSFNSTMITLLLAVYHAFSQLDKFIIRGNLHSLTITDHYNAPQLGKGIHWLGCLTQGLPGNLFRLFVAHLIEHPVIRLIASGISH